MNQHSASAPPPAGAGPRCATFAPLLPLAHTGDLTPGQAAALHEHLAECAWCRARLAEYDRLYAGLREHFGPEAQAPGVRIPSVREIADRAERPASTATVWTAWSGPLGLRPRLRPRFGLEVVAALLLLGLLGTLLVWQHGSGSVPPSASLDAQARAYVAVLAADYPPVLDALGVDSRQCGSAYAIAAPADKQQDMLACRPAEVAALTASQTFLDRLARATPPARWEAAHGELQGWAQALIRAFTDRIQAIDAHDTTRFAALGDSEVAPAEALSCAPIQQINADLPFASRLPESVSGACAS